MIAAPPPQVAAVFASYPAGARTGLLVLRQMIFDEAALLPAAGPLTEALRWGQPAYLTHATRAGSPLRLGIPKSGGFALYANCQTSLIADLAVVAGTRLRFEGNRAVLFEDEQEIAADLVTVLIRRALTWHLRRELAQPPAGTGATA